MRAIAAVRGASLCAMRRASPRGAAQGPKDMYSGAYLRLALLACASRGHYAAARRRACCRVYPRASQDKRTRRSCVRILVLTKFNLVLFNRFTVVLYWKCVEICLILQLGSRIFCVKTPENVKTSRKYATCAAIYK